MATLDSQLRRYRRAMNMQSINDAIQQEIVNIAATDESKLEDIATRKNRIAALRESLLTGERNRKLKPADTPELTALDEMTKKQIALDNEKQLKELMRLKRINDAMGVEDRNITFIEGMPKSKIKNELYTAAKEMSSIGRANRRILNANRSGMSAEDRNQSRNTEYSTFDNILFDESKPVARRPSTTESTATTMRTVDDREVPFTSSDAFALNSKSTKAPKLKTIAEKLGVSIDNPKMKPAAIRAKILNELDIETSVNNVIKPTRVTIKRRGEPTGRTFYK